MDLDPTQAANRAELAEYLQRLHTRADKPSYRQLEARTVHAVGLLPGTNLRRVPLKRGSITDVLAGTTFPRKAFLLTFVEACGVDLEADRRWEQAWINLADRRSDPAAEIPAGQLDELREQLAVAQHRAEAAEDHAAAATAMLREREGELRQSRPEGDRQRAKVISVAAASREGHRHAGRA